MHIVARSDGTRWTSLGGTWVQVFTRKEFLTTRWNYLYGEHVSIFGPTQLAGKTKLLFDLLASTDMTGLKKPPVMLVAKPRDKTVAAGIARLGWSETSKWPPRKHLFSQPEGYALWPKHLSSVSTAQNNAHIEAVF